MSESVFPMFSSSFILYLPIPGNKEQYYYLKIILNNSVLVHSQPFLLNFIFLRSVCLSWYIATQLIYFKGLTHSQLLYSFDLLDHFQVFIQKFISLNAPLKVKHTLLPGASVTLPSFVFFHSSYCHPTNYVLFLFIICLLLLECKLFQSVSITAMFLVLRTVLGTQQPLHKACAE